MANPFQEQFLKAGLADKAKVVQAKNQQRKKDKKRRQGEIDQLDDSQKQVLRANQQQADRDRALNQLKNQQAQQKAVGAQIGQLIEMNKIEPVEESVCFHFEDNKKIKQIEVDQKTRQKLVSGVLCIAKLDTSFYVIPKTVADKISQRDADYIVLANNPDEEESKAKDEYADFQVPDDLMW